MEVRISFFPQRKVMRLSACHTVQQICFIYMSDDWINPFTALFSTLFSLSLTREHTEFEGSCVRQLVLVVLSS